MRGQDVLPCCAPVLFHQGSYAIDGHEPKASAVIRDGLAIVPFGPMSSRRYEIGRSADRARAHQFAGAHERSPAIVYGPFSGALTTTTLHVPSVVCQPTERSAGTLVQPSTHWISGSS